MKDLIWTIIVIWVIYKLIHIFKSSSIKFYFGKTVANEEKKIRNDSFTAQPKKDVKTAIQKQIKNEGEYVDFEEIK